MDLGGCHLVLALLGIVGMANSDNAPNFVCDPSDRIQRCSDRCEKTLQVDTNSGYNGFGRHKRISLVRLDMRGGPRFIKHFLPTAVGIAFETPRCLASCLSTARVTYRCRGIKASDEFAFTLDGFGGLMSYIPYTAGGPGGLLVNVYGCHAIGPGFDSLRGRSRVKARLTSGPLGVYYVSRVINTGDDGRERCKRGCRFYMIFRLIDDSRLLDLNSSVDACKSSCKESYIWPGDAVACNAGCDMNSQLRDETLQVADVSDVWPVLRYTTVDRGGSFDAETMRVKFLQGSLLFLLAILILLWYPVKDAEIPECPPIATPADKSRQDFA
ncbi:hypothetical protein AAG570_004962 [Ranatra chinensis]|uniref:Uncharacterized protein n=1 Tax=Ranatra chinensis TaxID=642074 RepID=A0ABD0Y0N9_9HEMI